MPPVDRATEGWSALMRRVTNLYRHRRVHGRHDGDQRRAGMRTATTLYLISHEVQPLELVISNLSSVPKNLSSRAQRGTTIDVWDDNGCLEWQGPDQPRSSASQRAVGKIVIPGLPAKAEPRIREGFRPRFLDSASRRRNDVLNFMANQVTRCLDSMSLP